MIPLEQDLLRNGGNGADVSCVAYHAMLLQRCRAALKVNRPTPQQHGPQQPGPSGTGGHRS